MTAAIMETWFEQWGCHPPLTCCVSTFYGFGYLQSIRVDDGDDAGDGDDDKLNGKKFQKQFVGFKDI